MEKIAVNKQPNEMQHAETTDNKLPQENTTIFFKFKQKKEKDRKVKKKCNTTAFKEKEEKYIISENNEMILNQKSLYIFSKYGSWHARVSTKVKFFFWKIHNNDNDALNFTKTKISNELKRKFP